jgi:spore maturation protein SpmA
MALTYIWTGFFIVGFLAALAQWIFSATAKSSQRIVDGTFSSARFAVMDIALPLAA